MPHAWALADAEPDRWRAQRLVRDLLARTGDPEAEAAGLERRLKAAPDDLAARARLFWLMAQSGNPSARHHLRQMTRVRGEGRFWQRFAGTALERAKPLAPTTGRLADAVLMFPHIFKAGGSTLQRGLNLLFKPSYLRLLRVTNPRSIPDLPPEGWRNLDVVTGNFKYDEAQELLVPKIGKPALFIGVVRDPVSRAKSLFSFVRHTWTDPEERGARLGVAYDDDLNVVAQRWLERGAGRPRGANPQCRAICGKPSAARAIQAIEADYLAAVTTGSLDLLLATLSDAVGRPLEPVHRKNTRSGRLELDPQLERSLRELSAEDQKLVDWVDENRPRLLERAALALGVQAAHSRPLDRAAVRMALES